MTRKAMTGAMLQFVPFNLLFAGTLLLVLLVGSSRYHRVTTPRILRFFGHISYGLYLVHLLVFGMYDRVAGPLTQNSFKALGVRFLVCAAASTAIASLSRYTYEEWFLRMKERTRTSAPSAQAAVETA